MDLARRKADGHCSRTIGILGFPNVKQVGFEQQSNMLVSTKRGNGACCEIHVPGYLWGLMNYATGFPLFRTL